MTKTRGLKNKKVLLIFIPLVLSSFTSLWNITGFPSLHVDEGHYMRKAMSTLEGGSPVSYTHLTLPTILLV